MFCHKCGKELPDGTAFCAYCGEATGVGGNTDDANKGQSPNVEPSSVPEEPNKQEAAPSQAPETPAPEAPTPAPATPGGEGQKPSFLQSTPFRIILLVLGVALVAIGIFRILQGTGVIGSKPAEQAPQQQQQQTDQQQNNQQGNNQQQTSDKPEEKPSESSGKVDESKAKTSKGLITLYGCAELDGTQLEKIFKEHEYDQITDEGSTFLTPDGKYGLFVRTGAKKEFIGSKDIAKLKAGGEGTPVMYKIVATGYKTVADASKVLGNLKFEKSENTSNGLEVGIYKNTAGKRYLYVGQMEKENMAGLMLFNEEALAAGYQSKLGKSVDEVYASIVSASAKKDGAATNEVSIDEMKTDKLG